jgi:Protein of unknown function (DUF1579)
MKLCLRLVGTLVASLALAAAWAVAQEKKEAGGRHEADQPGAVHKQMANWAGEYTTSSKFFAKPGQPSEATTGSATIRSILDGRFLSEENAGTLLGQPYTGMHLYGYNNATGKYEATWIYTGSTATMTLTGTSKDDGRTIEYTASIDQKGTRMTLYVVLKHVDDDKFTVELYAKNKDGSKGPTLETTYTRKK